MYSLVITGSEASLDVFPLTFPITFSGAEPELTMNPPDSITNSISRNLTRFTFTNGSYEVLDKGLGSEQLILTGYEASTSSIEAMTKMDEIEDMMGQEITISGLDDTNLNTTYYIENLSYEEPLGHQKQIRYSLTLEKAG